MKSRTLRLLLVVLTVSAVAFVVWVIRSADGPGLPGFITRLYNFPYGDKLGHFLLMGSLAFLMMLTLAPRYQFPGLGVLAALIAIEEFSQRFFFGRHSDWLDLACSLAGLVVLGGLGMWLKRRLVHK
jgi:polysaccharide biosynthesis protein VpsQ